MTIDKYLISNRIVISSKNDGNLEGIMDFKRKIAWILLAGLILGLFGSFSFLLGMEPANPASINMRTFLSNPKVNQNGRINLDQFIINLTWNGGLSFDYENTKKITTHKISSFDGIEETMRRDGSWNNEPLVSRLHSLDSWWGKFYLHTRDKYVKNLNFDNQDFTEITCEDITYLKTIFPNLQNLSLKNNKISKVTGALNVRHLRIELEGNPLTSIEIETPEKCNDVTFVTDNDNVSVQFKQNIYSKTKTWFKSLIAKSKVVAYELLPSYNAVVTGVIVLGIYKFIKVATEPFIYENVERAKVIESLQTKSTEIVPSNMQEEVAVASLKTLLESLKLPIIKRQDTDPVKSFFSRSADAMLVSAKLIAAGKTLWDINKALKDSAKKNKYRISVLSSRRWEPIAEIPSGYAYNLFGKN